MEQEAEALIRAIRNHRIAHEGDSDDEEIDAAFEMEHAALRLLQKLAATNLDLAASIESLQSAADEGSIYAK